MYRFEDGEEATRSTMLNIVKLLYGCVDSTNFDNSCIAGQCVEDLEGFIHYIFDSGFDPKDRESFHHRAYGYDKTRIEGD